MPYNVVIRVKLMLYRELGNTKNYVSVIGQGIGEYGSCAIDSRYKQTYINAIRRSIDLNMNFIDTAESYLCGYLEKIISIACKGIRDKVFIATKVAPEHLSYNDIVKSCNGSLKRLGTNYIDLYQIHWPNPAIPIEESLRAMEMLKKEGKIRFVGISNFSLKQTEEVLSIYGKDNIVSNQVEYNLFDRTIENNLLSFCERKKISIIAYSPLNKGNIIGDRGKSNLLKEISKKYNKTPAQICLNWIIRNGNTIVIPKALQPEHVEENAMSSDFELEYEDMERINQAFKTVQVEIPIDEIKVTMDRYGARKVYQSLDDAVRNPLGFTPSPMVLAEGIKRCNEVIKPVRVRKSKDSLGHCSYVLIEGQIRYWAWTIAYKGLRPIPALIYE